MGVHGLLSHCLNYREQCATFVDLVNVAASRRDGIEILCDFYCVEHLLINSLLKSLALVSGNPYLDLLGGEYSSLGEYIGKLIDDLKSINIKLVMFIDSAKGTSVDFSEQKQQTWKSRHFRDLKRMYQRLDILCNVHRIEELKEVEGFRPVLLEVQIIETLKQCGCEMVYCTEYEADFVIARNLRNRPNAFAVLSNDSDFCIFNQCQFIPFELFDIDGNLGLGKERLPTKPSKLLVGLISSSKVWSLLGLNDEEEMIELSIIRGNDFTGPFLDNNSLRERIGLPWKSQLTDVVQWIKRHRVVENNSVIASEMNRSREFERAVNHARQFYKLILTENQKPEGNYLTNYIISGAENGDFPSHILAMHYGQYWHRKLIEEVGRNFPSAEVALTRLRSYIYALVLGQHRNRVTEYGRISEDREFDSVTVIAATARYLPLINTIQKDKMFPNLKTFHRIMSHQEPIELQTEWYKRYGWRNGFKCYILRYFLVLNFQKNLILTLDEFLPLVAVVFCQVDKEFYQNVHLLPSCRCVTIGNWFQNVYRHAFFFLGKVLNISHEFPQPCHIFSGAVWTAFYMARHHDIRFVGPQKLQQIRRDFDYIIKEKQHIIHYLVQGYFSFATGF